jgi:hypothetical protein
MVWDKLKKLAGIKGAGGSPSTAVGGPPQPAKPLPEITWISADKNPWHVPVLDVRPIALTMVSTSTDPQCAANAVSFGQDDGTAFAGQEPGSLRTFPSSLTFPIDRLLADGVLFAPRQMEQKWAIFFREDKLIFVRSWLRKVVAVAHTEQDGERLTVKTIRGSFGAEDEDAEFSERALDYLLRSHALNLPYPAPLPDGMESDPKAAALWCFSAFGNMAQCATPHRIKRHDPSAPLRTHSLLHIAVARADSEKIKAALAAGIPADLLAGDGLAPLHWALATDDFTVIELLLANGSPIDVRSDEGATPLMNAVQSNKIAAVSFLLQHGAQVDAQDLRGFTALHRAAEMGHLDVTKALLEAGASPTTDAQGHTPRSLAKQRGNASMISLLRAP